jgi:DNA-binding PucR family transcriptional regulator
VFVENAFRPGASAKQLGIHRHTLSYRLQQIAQLTKRDIRNGAHVLELAFALSLLDGTTLGVPLSASNNSP